MQFSLMPIAVTLVAGKGLSNGYAEAALAINGYVGDSEPLVFIKRRSDESFDGLFFYIGRNVTLFDISADANVGVVPTREGFYLSRVNWLEEQAPEWRARTSVIYSGGRRKDKAQEQIVLFKLTPASQTSKADEVLEAEKS